jgi:hypothetical protein
MNRMNDISALVDRIKDMDNRDRTLLLIYIATRHPDVVQQAIETVIDI